MLDSNRTIEDFFSFAQRHTNLYIYGAGSKGKRCYELLTDRGIDIKAFCVSKREDIGELLGHKVICIDDLKKTITSKDGIIPAFMGYDFSAIQNLFPYKQPEILSYNLTYLEILSEQRNFLPVLNEMRVGACKAVRDSDYLDWKEILIIRIDEIGDVIMTTPLIRELKKLCPQAEITVAARPYNKDLLLNCPYVKSVAVYNAPKRSGDLSDQCEQYGLLKENIDNFISKELKGTRFDAVFICGELLSGNNVVDTYYLAMKCGAPYRFAWMLDTGLDREQIYEWTKEDFTQLSMLHVAQHEVRNVLSMLNVGETSSIDDTMELWTDTASEKRITELTKGKIKNDKINVVLGIMASVPARTWGTENYVQLIDKMACEYPEKYRFIILGGQDAVESAALIVQSANGEIINLAGMTTLNESVACMAMCDIYVGSNTGILHMASAMKKTSVTIYAVLPDRQSTDGDSPERMGAYGVEHIDLIPAQGIDGCHQMCRMRYPHCINQITPQEVEDSIIKIISKKE